LYWNSLPAALSWAIRCSTSRTFTSRSFVVVWISNGVFSFAAFQAGDRRRYTATSWLAVLPM
jgi:hypothetical protein